MRARPGRWCWAIGAAGSILGIGYVVFEQVVVQENRLPASYVARAGAVYGFIGAVLGMFPVELDIARRTVGYGIGERLRQSRVANGHTSGYSAGC